mgnify:CR=1 FL=1
MPTSEPPALDFESVRAKLGMMRYDITDVMMSESTLVVEYLVLRSRDYGFSSMMYVPRDFQMVASERSRSEERSWNFRYVSPASRFVNLSDINVQDMYAEPDISNAYNFTKRIKNHYQLAVYPEPGIHEDEALVFLNDAIRQMRRFHMVCRNTDFGLCISHGPYVVVMHNGSSSVSVLHVQNAGEFNKHPEFSFLSSSFHIEQIRTLMEDGTLTNMTEAMPRFEEALITVLDGTTDMFEVTAKNGPVSYPDFVIRIAASNDEKRKRIEAFRRDERLVYEEIGRRNILIELIRTASESDLPNARANYDAHKLAQRAVIDQFQISRQRMYAWMFLSDRIAFDGIIFLQWISKNMSRLEGPG